MSTDEFRDTIQVEPADPENHRAMRALVPLTEKQLRILEDATARMLAEPRYGDEVDRIGGVRHIMHASRQKLVALRQVDEHADFVARRGDKPRNAPVQVANRFIRRVVESASPEAIMGMVPGITMITARGAFNILKELRVTDSRQVDL